jgi:hypothetical protein
MFNVLAYLANSIIILRKFCHLLNTVVLKTTERLARTAAHWKSLRNRKSILNRLWILLEPHYNSLLRHKSSSLTL